VKQAAILTIDVEDWHQLVHRRLGVADWDRARPEFPRQMHALFALMDELDVRPTLFLLGMTVARYTEVAREAAGRGYEIGSHGYAHRRVYTQSEAEFREDVRRSVDAIGEATGKRPSGYRAPEFSINRDTPWAYESLAGLGFRYDSSQYDSPRIPRRIRPAVAAARSSSRRKCASPGAGSSRRRYAAPMSSTRAPTRPSPSCRRTTAAARRTCRIRPPSQSGSGLRSPS